MQMNLNPQKINNVVDTRASLRLYKYKINSTEKPLIVRMLKILWGKLKYILFIATDMCFAK
jgi:hypothetical protein